MGQLRRAVDGGLVSGRDALRVEATLWIAASTNRDEVVMAYAARPDFIWVAASTKK